MRGPKTERLEILNGWKEIANYLRKGVRTVQRYEREMGLPTHQPARSSSRGVVTIRTELDNWVATRPGRGESMPRRQALDTRTNRLGANFLQTDSQIALTFSGLALEA